MSRFGPKDFERSGGCIIISTSQHSSYGTRTVSQSGICTITITMLSPICQIHHQHHQPPAVCTVLSNTGTLVHAQYSTQYGVLPKYTCRIIVRVLLCVVYSIAILYNILHCAYSNNSSSLFIGCDRVLSLTHRSAGVPPGILLLSILMTAPTVL